MATSLRGGREWEKRIKVNTGSDAPKLNPKDPIQAAVMGRVIRDINNGNFDSIGNLQTTADAFQTQESSSGPVVIGREDVTTVKDTDGAMHEITDAATLKVMLDQGMTIVSVKTVEVTA